MVMIKKKFWNFLPSVYVYIISDHNLLDMFYYIFAWLNPHTNYNKKKYMN